MVILSDADLEIAARRILWVKLSPGQTCIAPDYILVENSVKPAFIDALRKVLIELRAGEPTCSASSTNASSAGSPATRFDERIHRHRRAAPTRRRSPSSPPSSMNRPHRSGDDRRDLRPGPPVLGIENAEAAVIFVNSRP